MSDQNDKNWSENTPFEQKLAAYEPRLLRDVKAAVLREMQPRPMPFMQQWQAFEQTARPYLLVGVCCFLLGAVVMYGVMCCFFDRGPMRSGPLLAAKSQPSYTYTVPLNLRDLDEVRTPADLARQLRQQPIVVVKPEAVETEPPTQRNILRAFGDISRI